MINLIKVLAIAELFVISCVGCRNGKPVEAEMLECDGVTVVDSDEVMLMVIQDTPSSVLRPNKLFYGENGVDSVLVDSLSPAGGVRSAINCFVAKTGSHTMLFDAGLGSGGGGMLLSRMDSIGMSVDDIDAVFITHCHGDHIGGLLGAGDSAVFPKAKVYVPAAEIDYWSGKSDKIELMKNAYGDRMIYFDYAAELPYGVTAYEAAGHTPGHTVYGIGDFIIAGDLMHGVDIQLGNPEICAGYDMDRQQSIDTRRKWLDYAKSNGKILAGAHFDSGVLRL